MGERIQVRAACPSCGPVLIGAELAVPFELLEAHAGPALSWDDLLDFKLALDRSPWPQVELDA